MGRWAKARGTRTFWWRGTEGAGGSGDDADSSCTPAPVNNFKLTLTSTTVHNVTHDVTKNTTDELGFAFTTEAGQPNNADWPTGDYRAQVDINALESGDLSLKLALHRVNSGCTSQETLGTSGSYSTTGTHLYTASSVDPSSGAAGDRFQVRVLCTNTALHQNQLVTLGVRSTDSYADGPWSPIVDTSRAARTEGCGPGTTVAYVDKTESISSASRANPSFSHTVPAGSNRYLKVVFCSLSESTVVSYDGTPLAIVQENLYDGVYLQVWALVLGSSASPTTADVAVTAAASVCDYIVALNYTGVNQGDPYGSKQSNAAGGSTVSNTLTPETSGSIIVQFAAALGYSSAPIEWQSSQVERWNGYTDTVSETEDLACGGSDIRADYVQEYVLTVRNNTDGIEVIAIEIKESGGTETSSTRDARTEGASAGTQTSDTRDARTAGKVTDSSSTRDARTAGEVADVSSSRDARTEGQATTSDTRDARTAGKITDASSSRDARTLGGVTTASDRDARTAGKVTDASSTRDARTAGEVADTSSARSARTAGKVAGANTSRDARTSGQVTAASARAARTAGKVADANTNRAARTLGGTTVSTTRDARTEGVVTGTQTSSTRKARTSGKVTDASAARDARIAGKVSDASSSRDARTEGQATTSGTRDARTAGKVVDAFSTRDARTSGEVADVNDSRSGRTAGEVSDQASARSARTAGEVADVSSARSARTAGEVAGTQTSDTRDARTAGEATDSDSRDARTAGKVSGSASARAARTLGGIVASSTRSARTAGSAVPVYPPSTAGYRQPDPSEAGGRVPSPEFRYVESLAPSKLTIGAPGGRKTKADGGRK